MMNYILAIFYLIQAISCTDFYITSPYNAVSWAAGKPAKITWNVIPGGADVSSVNVDLMDGDDGNAHVLMSIANGLSPATTFVEWVVPSDFPETNTVFVRVSGVGGGSSILRYSHRFIVKGSESQQEAPNKPVQAAPSKPVQEVPNKPSQATAPNKPAQAIPSVVVPQNPVVPAQTVPHVATSSAKVEAKSVEPETTAADSASTASVTTTVTTMKQMNKNRATKNAPSILALSLLFLVIVL